MMTLQATRQPTTHPTRHELAAALVTACELDHTLLQAIAVSEARNPGYAGRILEIADGIAAVAIIDPDAPARPTLAESSVLAALRNSDVRLALDTVHALPSREATNALMNLLVAQAAFHKRGCDLERRTLGRTPAPAVRVGLVHS